MPRSSAGEPTPLTDPLAGCGLPSYVCEVPHVIDTEASAFSTTNVVESLLGLWFESPPKLALAVAVPAFVLSE